MLQQLQFCCRKSGKQLEEEEDENDVLLTDSMYSVLNVVCPISGKPVVDLEYPVRRWDVFTHKDTSNLCAHFIFGGSSLHLHIVTSSRSSKTACPRS
jgi:hypothetical protein